MRKTATVGREKKSENFMLNQVNRAESGQSTDLIN